MTGWVSLHAIPKGTISSEADNAQGAWGGKGVKKRKTNPKFLKTTAGIEASERKDAGKNNVIITEKKDKKARQFQVKDLPYPYTSIAQYEARFNNPLGAEWNSRSIHQKETMPRVTKKVCTLSWHWVLVLIRIYSEAQLSSPSGDYSRSEAGFRAASGILDAVSLRKRRVKGCTGTRRHVCIGMSCEDDTHIVILSDSLIYSHSCGSWLSAKSNGKGQLSSRSVVSVMTRERHDSTSISWQRQISRDPAAQSAISITRRSRTFIGEYSNWPAARAQYQSLIDLDSDVHRCWLTREESDRLIERWTPGQSDNTAETRTRIYLSVIDWIRVQFVRTASFLSRRELAVPWVLLVDRLITQFD